MSRSVPLVGRVLDGVSALLFVAGAILYGRSWIGLRDQDAITAPSGTAGTGGEGFAFTAVERVEDLHRLGDQGLALMGLGAILAVVAAVTARRLAARSDSDTATGDPSP